MMAPHRPAIPLVGPEEGKGIEKGVADFAATPFSISGYPHGDSNPGP